MIRNRARVFNENVMDFSVIAKLLDIWQKFKFTFAYVSGNTAAALAMITHDGLIRPVTTGGQDGSASYSSAEIPGFETGVRQEAHRWGEMPKTAQRTEGKRASVPIVRT